MLCNHGDLHYEQRTILLRCLTTPKLQTLLNTVRPHVEATMKKWAEKGVASHVDHAVTKTAFIMAQTMVFGEYDEPTNHIIEPLFEAVNRGCISMPLNLPFMAYGKAWNAKKVQSQLLQKKTLNTY
jgi:hypothetical protein